MEWCGFDYLATCVAYEAADLTFGVAGATLSGFILAGIRLVTTWE